MKTNNTLTKLFLMVITLPKGKKEIIGDLLEKFDVTTYVSTLAKGARDEKFTQELMFCIIKEDQIKDAFLKIQDKFARFHNNLSMVYAIPLDSIIGVSTYMALTNGGIS